MLLISRIVRSLLLVTLFPLTSNAAVVLQYHHIDNDTSASTSTSVELFRQQIEHIRSKEYKIVSLPDLIYQLKNRTVMEGNIVAITFDDGYESVYHNAFPILKTYKIPFTIFVNTESIEENRKNHVSWAQLREMKKHGATIANHTHRHSHLIRYQEDIEGWTKRVSKEINKAQRIINERLNQDIKLLAYPYGEFDTDTLKLIRSLNYTAFGQHSGAINEDSNLQRLPRFPASNRFGKLPQLITKLQSTVFKNVSFEPMHDVLTSEQLTPPLLNIKGDNERLKTINCYGPNGKLTKSIHTGRSLSFQSPKPITMRRFGYNCTAKAQGENKFMWVSIPWINPAIKEY
jgi:biofilm PGA synthesis lipoprotein PgaB